MTDTGDAASRPLWMEIDLGALRHNYGVLRQRVGPQVHIVPALKGNGYGHGAGAVAQALADADVAGFAAGTLADARAIRDAGYTGPVVLFGGPLPADLTNAPNAATGDAVTLLGVDGADTVTLEDLAAWWGIGAVHVLMSFNRRMAARHA